jgi:hypothetical protein
MANLVRFQNRLVNLDCIWWVDDDAASGTVKVYFEKSTILIAPKAEVPEFLEAVGMQIGKAKTNMLVVDGPKKKVKIGGQG